MKELILAGILLSISTVLKVCCVVVLVNSEALIAEHEHDHHEVILVQKKAVQTSHQPVV